MSQPRVWERGSPGGHSFAGFMGIMGHKPDETDAVSLVIVVTICVQFLEVVLFPNILFPLPYTSKPPGNSNISASR